MFFLKEKFMSFLPSYHQSNWKIEANSSVLSRIKAMPIISSLMIDWRQKKTSDPKNASGIDKTQVDLGRTPHIAINGKSYFILQENGTIPKDFTLDQIIQDNQITPFLEKTLKGTDPKIIEYLANNLHQDGLSSVGRTLLAHQMKNCQFILGPQKINLQQNKDGSVSVENLSAINKIIDMTGVKDFDNAKSYKNLNDSHALLTIDISMKVELANDTVKTEIKNFKVVGSGNAESKKFFESKFAEQLKPDTSRSHTQRR